LKRLSSFFSPDDEDTFPTSSPRDASHLNNEEQPSEKLGEAPNIVEIREKKVDEMRSLTKLSKDECVFHLESMNWDVHAATKSYYEFLR
jgi:hypothetical protein